MDIVKQGGCSLAGTELPCLKIDQLKHRNLFLVTIALGVLLNPLNSSMIAVALDRIQHAFYLNFTSASWLISTYYLASAIAQPVMGKLADTFGQKRLFLTGLCLVALSSAIAPFSPTFAWLIALRLVQSVGSSAIFPAGMGIVRKYITEGQAKALAFLAVFSSGAAAFGPSVGGLFMHFGDWPVIFWINFPFIIASTVLGIWILPGDNRTAKVNGLSNSNNSSSGGNGHNHNDSSDQGPDLYRAHGTIHDVIRKLDIVGILFFASSIIFSLLFLLSLTSNVTWWAGILAIIAITLFLSWELRIAVPFISLKMFKENMALSWVLIQFVTVNIIFYSIFFGIPTYLQEVRHFSARYTGILMLFVAGFGVITSPIAGRWVEKHGSRPPLIFAGFCMTIGSALYLTLRDASPVWWLAVILTVLGLSNGFNNVGLQTALFRVTPANIISAASGLFQTARYMGTILSTVLLGILFGSHLSTLDLHHMGIILAALGILVILMSVRLPKKS
jgi:MFS family permease